MSDERSDEATGETTDPGAAGGTRRRLLGGSRDERGFVLVWTTLFLMVLLGFAALAVDLGHSYYVGQREQNAADAAALAGAVYLPGNVGAAQTAAQELAASNGFTDGADNVTVSTVQDPGNPSQLLVTIHQSVPTWFGKAIGFRSMDVAKSATGVASEASTTTQVDMVIVLDRTGSMTNDDIDDLHDASDALLGSLNPDVDHVALAALGQSSNGTQCAGGGAYGVATTSTTAMTWMIAPYASGSNALLSDYQLPGGALNPNSQIVKSIDCITAHGSQSGVGTDLGDPLVAAAQYLQANHRPGAQLDILFMTDGAANKPTAGNACTYANNDAATVKAAGINVVTIGFGVGHAPYASGDPSFPGANATTLLASMASPVNGVPSLDDHDCNTPTGQAAEDTDGDNFFCPAKGSNDLASVFVTAAQQITGAEPRLVK